MIQTAQTQMIQMKVMQIVRVDNSSWTESIAENSLCDDNSDID